MNKRLLFIVFIICLVVGFLIGYITILKENVVVIEAITAEEAEDIINNFTLGYGCNNIEDYTNNTVITNKDLSNDRVFQVVQYLEFNDLKAVTLEEVKRKVALYYGNDYNFDPKNLTDMCSMFTYNKEDKIFYHSNDFCVVNCGNNQTIYKVKDINVDNSFIEININVLFSSEGESLNYYKDYDRKEVVDDINLDLGDLYVLKFKKIGSNYQFVSSQKKH